MAAAAGVAVRAILIAGIGLAIGKLDSGIAVILTYYGALFLLGIPFLVLRTPWLLVLAATWLAVVPVIAHLVRPKLPARGYDNPSFESLHDLGRLLSELTFTGYYPAVPWLAYLLVGLAIGRMDLTRWRAPAVLASAGAALVVAAVAISDALLRRPGVRDELADSFSIVDLDQSLAEGTFGSTPTDSWWWLAVRAPHSATTFDLAQTIGSALVVLSVCLVLGRLLPSFTAVLFGAGAMTLTLYTAHVLLRVEVWDDETLATYIGQLGAALAFGAVFALTATRGPLEAIVGALSKVARRVVGGRPRPADHDLSPAS